MDLGQRIKSMRKKAGLTQAQLAESVGLSTIAIRQYESGVRCPKYETVERIAKAMKCDISSLLSTSEEATMIIDELIKKLTAKENTDSDSSSVTDETDDEFIEMLQSRTMQTLGQRWWAQSEKRRKEYCQKKGWPFIEAGEPFDSDSRNAHIAEILIVNGVFPSSIESLVSAGISCGTAYSIMRFANNAKENDGQNTEDESVIAREEEVAVILERLAMKTKLAKEADDDAPQDNP